MVSMSKMGAVWRSAGSTVAERLFLDRQAEFWMGELDPVRSISELRARVVEVIEETRDTKTFVLRPNAAWHGHRAGQYTSVEAEIDGVRVRRCYSISSAPSEALLSITVKRVADGRMSTWLHENVRAGHILGLGAPAGDFVLPSPTPDKLLLLSGGSGITPVMSMLRDLAARDAIRDVVFVHHARSQAEVIFGEDRDALRVELAGQRRRIQSIVDVRNLVGGERDDVVPGIGAIDDVEVVEVAPGGAHDDRADAFHDSTRSILSKAQSISSRVITRGGAKRMT